MAIVWESHEQSIIDEYKDLEFDIARYVKFVEDDAGYKALAAQDQQLLVSQLDHMKAYLGILNKRIVRMTLAKCMPI